MPQERVFRFLKPIRFAEIAPTFYISQAKFATLLMGVTVTAKAV
jgi:hypothetical protein